MTHRQSVVWQLFLQGNAMEPSLTDMYLMQVAWAAYYANATKRPPFSSKEWLLKSEEQAQQQVVREEDKPPSLRGLVKKKPPTLAQQEAAIAKAKWMAASSKDGPIRGLPPDHPMQNPANRPKPSGGR